LRAVAVWAIALLEVPFGVEEVVGFGKLFIGGNELCMLICCRIISCGGMAMDGSFENCIPLLANISRDL
jgi:hypothetical protein